ncbi:MAG: DUF507 family protein [Nitrospinaceae bacterium]|nr:DUF507 family protein [Nitrospinaceae bacterium]NIR56517.1 DUF507 family protein [Nitrospinaceae bacterium]NIS86975.1 DUF507 family protein [Nitrospinaceae bacterium]NIT83819.1 DUF507 family protein [Nitrospinaceae bacterium]NIU46025.1 DUF507 family protein [Nitrospinaceae bacterium]
MKLSRDKINHISSLIVQDFEKREELDYKMDLNDVRLEIARVMLEELKLDDKADQEARKIIASYKEKKIREGTDEWDIMYQKHYEESLKKLGV